MQKHIHSLVIHLSHFKNSEMKTEFVGNIAYVVETGHIFVISGRTLTGAERYFEQIVLLLNL